MTNKLVISRLGNDKYRFFAFNKPIIEGDYFNKYTTDEEKVKENLIAFELYETINRINLVIDVSIRKYEVSVGIADGFEDDIDEWDRIISEVEALLTETVFGPSQVYAKTERDLSKEYQRAALDAMDE